MTKLVVVSAGLSSPSSTRNLADQLTVGGVTALGGAAEVDVVMVELRELAHEITDNLITGFPVGALAGAAAAVSAADALIVVTPVFSASYSGLFKSFFDILDVDALVDKPVLIAATAGTPRHSLVLEYALRPLFGYLRAIPVATAVFAATEDFGSAALAERVERATKELATAVTGRPRLAAVDPFEQVTPFEQYLSAVSVGAAADSGSASSR